MTNQKETIDVAENTKNVWERYGFVEVKEEVKEEVKVPRKTTKAKA